MRPSRPARIGRWVVVAGILIWSLGPIVVALITSLSSNAQLSQSKVPGPLLPHPVSVAAFEILFGLRNPPAGRPGQHLSSQAGAFGHSLAFSGLITVETTALVLVISVLAGYAFSRIDFRGRAVVFYAVLASLTLPLFALVVPLFRLLTGLGLVNTNFGLLLVYTLANTPLAVWLFAVYCRELPEEPQQAALLDGCSPFGALVKVVLPQMRSGIAAITGIVALLAWGEFLIPLFFAQSDSLKPVTVMVTDLVGQTAGNYPVVAAAGIVAVIPPAIVALVLNRHIRGMLAGWSG